MSLIWIDKTDNVDEIHAEDVNSLAHSIQQLEMEKVDKIEGKTLTSNDFTDTDKAKLDGLENYNDTAVKALIANKVDKVDGMGLCNANFVDMTVYKDETGATIGVRKNSDGVLITYEDFYTKKGTNEKLSGKQDKVEGKTLTSNDFTDTDKAKLDGLENYNDTAVKALIAKKVDKVDGYGLSQIKDMGQNQIPVDPPIEVAFFTLHDGSEPTIEYYSTGTLDNMFSGKTDKPILSSDTKSIKIDTNSGNKVDVPTAKGVFDDISGKQDKTVYYNPTTAGAITYDLKNEHNRMTSYIGADAATSVTILVSNGAYRNDYISGLSFYTGSTPPEVSYPSSPYTMRWIGSECTTSGESSVFSPIANRVYDIIFYFNGGYIVGLVNGYDDIA